ncbi:MAG: DUF2157 domain-containing protein [Magnetococcales bacterium]|nr:DUF2157 domain-containing protein [Magnetococcales bacterium]
MDIQKAALDQAVAQHILTAETSEQLWLFLENRHRDQPSFQGTHILYYLGGLIAIAALSLFITVGWATFGGWGLFGIALSLGVGTVSLAHWFLDRQKLAIPAGIMLALTVVLVPLAIYGLQTGLGFWGDGLQYRDYHTHIDWRWLLMELGTLAAGALLLWQFRLPFAVMPVAVTLWYISLDLTPFLTGHGVWEGNTAQIVSLCFGLGTLLLALWVDWRNRSDRDFAFWLYIFGVMTFWGGLSLLNSTNELNQLLYCCLNVGLVWLGGILQRRVFAVFGGLGLAGYLFHLSYRVFANSILFPFVLAGVGLGMVYLGSLWQKNEARLATHHQRLLPATLLEMVARRG